jgi:hypothetical protein
MIYKGLYGFQKIYVLMRTSMYARVNSRDREPVQLVRRQDRLLRCVQEPPESASAVRL